MTRPRGDRWPGVVVLASVMLVAGCKGNTEMTPGSPTGPTTSAAPATSRATGSPDPATSGQQGAYQGGVVAAPSGSAVPGSTTAPPPASATTAPAPVPAPQPRRPKVG